MDILIIGPSLHNVKTLDVSKRFLDGNFIIDKHNWSGYEVHDDVFEVSIKDGICRVKRLDSDSGWGMMLGFETKVNEINTKEMVPLFFINLDKDVERRQTFEEMIYKIFKKEHVIRIPGVVHELGVEGCRLAHINANITAINYGYDHYIICENDIKPIIADELIYNYMIDTTTKNINMVLFEMEMSPFHVKMRKITDNLYRFYEGGNDAGCYLCRRDFGAVLLKIWMQYPRRHIDHTWKDLFYPYKIFFHRPQIFIQKAGPSNQSDIDYRQERTPFHWGLYEQSISS